MLNKAPMSMMLYNRLISYLHYMKRLPEESPDNISSTVIASALNLNDVQVRKDLALVSDGGKPKIGYLRKDLIADLQHFLGHDSCSEAALVGVGNLGKALLSYDNFRQYGLKIVAAFDVDPDVVGEKIGDTQIFAAEKIPNLCRRLNVHIGIITVPALSAQAACDQLVAGGIRAVWNFAPVNLTASEKVIVKNEDIVASLAILTRRLEENIAQYGLD